MSDTPRHYTLTDVFARYGLDGERLVAEARAELAAMFDRADQSRRELLDQIDVD